MRKLCNSIQAFLFYSWTTSLVWLMLDILPPPLRRLCHKIALGSLGDGSNLDYAVYVRYPSRVHIGAGCMINRGCKFFPALRADGGQITLGNRVVVGPEVVFFAAGHDPATKNLDDTAAPIVVEDGVWIGGRSVILQSVTLGEGCIVAAGSVVTKSVAPYAIVAGVPASIRKYRKIIDR